MLNKIIIASLTAFGLTACAHSTAAAHPVRGEWRLNPRLCPDLREDILDNRIITGRRDLREDRRDKAVTNCPARAYVWVGPPRTKSYHRPPKPRYEVIYIDKRGHYYGRNKGRSIRIKITS